jgi:hypothetical protein
MPNETTSDGAAPQPQYNAGAEVAKLRATMEAGQREQAAQRSNAAVSAAFDGRRWVNDGARSAAQRLFVSDYSVSVDERGEAVAVDRAGARGPLGDVIDAWSKRADGGAALRASVVQPGAGAPRGMPSAGGQAITPESIEAMTRDEFRAFKASYRGRLTDDPCSPEVHFRAPTPNPYLNALHERIAHLRKEG